MLVLSLPALFPIHSLLARRGLELPDQAAGRHPHPARPAFPDGEGVRHCVGPRSDCAELCMAPVAGHLSRKEFPVNKPRVAVIGTGTISKLCHVPGYQAAGAEIVGLCDVHRERAEAVAAEFKVQTARIYTDWLEMLEKERPDAVSVCLPNTLHEGPVLAALDLGAHVICEKPLAPSVAVAQGMFDKARKTGKVLMAAQNYRWQPGIPAIKQAIDEGLLGDIYYAEATAMRRLGIPSWGDFHQSAFSAGGPMLDIGVHMLDQALWLMGNPRAVRVSATVERRFGQRADVAALRGNAWNPATYDVEDFAVAFVRLETGATILIRASWAGHVDFPSLMTARVLGSEAGVVTEPPAIYRLRGGSLTDERFTTPNAPSAYMQEIAHWVEVIKGNAEPLVREVETMNVQRILNGAYESAALGCEVEIPANA